MREERERSPGRGIGRPTVARGGRRDIAEEPIGARRTEEGREKRRDPAAPARAARRAADEMRAREGMGGTMGGEGPATTEHPPGWRPSRGLKLGESRDN